MMATAHRSGMEALESSQAKVCSRSASLLLSILCMTHVSNACPAITCLLTLGPAEKAIYGAGTYGAVLPSAAQAPLAHHHHHQQIFGFRSGMHSQSNPFSRGPKAQPSGKNQQGTHDSSITTL